MRRYKMKSKKMLSTFLSIILLSGCTQSSSKLFETTTPEEAPVRYKVTGVHDPSVIKGESMIFMVGSHLDSAYTEDYIDFTRFSSGVKNGNLMIPQVQDDMKEALEWAKTDTFWAGDIIQLEDGKYYFYYSVCEGSSPLAAIGYAVSDKVEGPYENQGIIMKSGRSGKLLAYEPERNIQYDPNIHPNAIDPTLFYDKTGQLQMVYGSYSGGIFILEVDEKTKMPKSGQGYGKRITGGKHSRIENPYIIYDETSDYYYFYASFGGLGSGHGYQTRVARAKEVTGPYLDAKGQDINKVSDNVKKMFDDEAINLFGNKLMGDFEFTDSDNKKMNFGYVSPGGASFIYDKDIDKTMMVFHTRFPGRGEAHELRSHTVHLNQDNWPVIAPIRYSGVDFESYESDASGKYQYIVNNLQIIGNIEKSIAIDITEADPHLDFKQEGHFVELTLNNIRYKGVALRQWDVKRKAMVKTISLQGEDNTTIWAIEE